MMHLETFNTPLRVYSIKYLPIIPLLEHGIVLPTIWFGRMAIAIGLRKLDVKFAIFPIRVLKVL